MDQPLRFGTYVEFQCPPGGDHAELIWDVIAVGEQADRLGYEVFTCLEHPWFEQFAIMPAPLPLFCTLAQRTRNLTFRTICHTLPLHNPLVLAGEIATADILLDGRLEVGVGRGHAWLQEPANIVLEENVERYPECLDILEKAWTEDRFSYDGKYYTAKDLSVVPKPLQKPHPKIFQVGTSAKWFQRAAEKATASRSAARRRPSVFREPAKLYRQLCEEPGTEPYLGWIKAIYLDEDEDRAMEEAREPVLNFIEFNVSPIDSLARTLAGGEAAADRRRLRVLRGRRLPRTPEPLLRAAPRARDRLRRHAGEGRRPAARALGRVPLRGAADRSRHYGGTRALAVDEDPVAVRPRHHADASREAALGGRSGRR